MKFLVDVERFPRPERSGVISVIALYVLICAACDVWNAPFMEGRPLTVRALACWAMPWECLARRQQEVERVKPPDDYLVGLVYIPPSVDPKKKKHQPCFLRPRSSFQGWGYELLDCSSCSRLLDDARSYTKDYSIAFRCDQEAPLSVIGRILPQGSYWIVRPGGVVVMYKHDR